MNCAKCGLELPASVKTCPKCGMVNEFVEAEAPAAPRKVKPIVYVLAGLAVLAIVATAFAVIAGRGNKDLTTAPSGRPGSPNSVMSAPGGKPGGGGLMNAPSGKPGTGEVTPAGVTKPKPPKSVEDYLNFVKRVEEHRQMLLKDTTDALTLAASGGGTQSLLNLIDMAMDPEGKEAQDPLAETKKELNRQYKNWLTTLSYFEKQPAPDECRDFSAAYRDVLYRETKAIGEIAVSFNSVNVMESKDMSKLLGSLQKIKNDPSIQTGIDKAADGADGKLTELVSNYDMKKPFDVPREQKTSGSIMGF